MKKQGFSLVELSIVLVILGLLTGGILTGQSLIRAAELRSVTTDFNKYQTATMTFRDRYMGLPGDLRNATDFWGASSVCSGSAASGTCSGNGDGLLQAASAANATGENQQFWRHLMLAGLIEGNYTGLTGSGSQYHCPIPTSCPSSKISNAGWGVASGGGPSPQQYDVTYGSFITFGNAHSSNIPLNAALTPEEAWNIDSKIDDGLPARGKIIGRYWNNACAEAVDGTPSHTDLNAVYRVSDTSIQCALFFREAF